VDGLLLPQQTLIDYVRAYSWLIIGTLDMCHDSLSKRGRYIRHCVDIAGGLPPLTTQPTDHSKLASIASETMDYCAVYLRYVIYWMWPGSFITYSLRTHLLSVKHLQKLGYVDRHEQWQKCPFNTPPLALVTVARRMHLVTKTDSAPLATSVLCLGLTTDCHRIR
jgi:hypothetical protein